MSKFLVFVVDFCVKFFMLTPCWLLTFGQSLYSCVAFPFDFYPPSHPRLPFFPSTRRVDFKSTGWCWDRQQHRATTRATTTAPPSSKYMRSSALSIAPSARSKAFQSTNKRDKRARHVVPYFSTVITFHVKNATQHLHQNCVRLPVATTIWRTFHTLLLNASTTYAICWPGVESSYTSICLSFGNSLYVILQRWLNIPLRPNILTYRTL